MNLLARWVYPPEAAVLSHVRKLVVRHLPALRLAERADDVVLVVTELATNAILHARTPFEVRLLSRADGGRIEVHDASPILPSAGALAVDANCGRGLTVVDALSSRWGVRRTEAGKVVWCEMSTQEPTDPVSGAHSDPGGLLLAQLDNGDPSTPDDHALTVAVTDLPVPALLAAKAAIEDLLRDAHLLLLRYATPAEVPDDMVGLVKAARRLDAAAAAFADARRQVRSQALAAETRDLRTVTLHLWLSPASATAALEYREALQNIEDLADTSTFQLAFDQAVMTYSPVHRHYLNMIIEQLTARR